MYGENTKLVKKLTYEYVKSKFEKEGWELLSKNYINARTKLKCTCPNDHLHEKTWDGFLQGSRCDECKGKHFYTYEEVKKKFESEDYILLSKEYGGDSTRLDFICPNGHTHNIVWTDFRQGKRCGRCKGNIKISYNQISVKFSKEGYTLLSKEYENSITHLNYLCPFGHKHSMSWSNFNNGKRCPTCKIINMVGENHPNWLGGYRLSDYCDAWKDKIYKEDLRKRDNNICQNPYCYKTALRLHIHHIDYNKKNCHPSNLITICVSCNSRANKDRDWHTKWYQTLMNKKYRYRY